MNRLIMAIAIAAALICAASCKSKTGSIAPSTVTATVKPDVLGDKPAMMPKAVIYRMNGDYSRNVPVSVSPEGQLLSFPAPSDITEAAMPVDLGNGWWLDRRGISSNSLFTRYTYADYAAMKSVPSPGEIMKAIIPGARPTDLRTLPMTPSEAAADIQAVKRWIEENK